MRLGETPLQSVYVHVISDPRGERFVFLPTDNERDNRSKSSASTTSHKSSSVLVLLIRSAYKVLHTCRTLVHDHIWSTTTFSATLVSRFNPFPPHTHGHTLRIATGESQKHEKDVSNSKHQPVLQRCSLHLS